MKEVFIIFKPFQCTFIMLNCCCCRCWCRCWFLFFFLLCVAIFNAPTLDIFAHFNRTINFSRSLKIESEDALHNSLIWCMLFHAWHHFPLSLCARSFCYNFFLTFFPHLFSFVYQIDSTPIIRTCSHDTLRFSCFF